MHFDVFGEGRYPGAVNLGNTPRTTTTNVAGTPVPYYVFKDLDEKDATKNRLPFADGTFSLVTAESGPFEFPGVASEMLRVAVPGGAVVLLSAYPAQDQQATRLGRMAALSGGYVEQTFEYEGGKVTIIVKGQLP